MDANKLSVMMNAFSIKRYHTIQTLRTQTVGDHTARVMALALYLGGDSLNLMKAILEHDALEIFTGDIPATAKWDVEFNKAVDQLENRFNRDVGLDMGKSLSEEEATILKVADMLELCLWCSEECYMGNENMNAVFLRGAQYIQNLTMPRDVRTKVELLLSGDQNVG